MAPYRADQQWLASLEQLVKPTREIGESRHGHYTDGLADCLDVLDPQRSMNRLPRLSRTDQSRRQDRPRVTVQSTRRWLERKDPVGENEKGQIDDIVRQQCPEKGNL